MELLTMATQTLPSPHILEDDDAPQAAAPTRSRKPPFMRRLYIAILISQQRRAQRHIDRVLGDDTYHRRPLRPKP
jgi:hypothetical protein